MGRQIRVAVNKSMSIVDCRARVQMRASSITSLLFTGKLVNFFMLKFLYQDRMMPTHQETCQEG